MKRLAFAAYVGALILTATACGDIEDPAPTTGLATVSSSTSSSASEPTTTTSTTTSEEVSSETFTEPVQVEEPAPEPAPEPDAPAPDEQPAHFIAPAPAQQPKSAYYGSCDAARSAGAAPLYAGDPGYRAGLDRDGDGVACE